MDAYSILFFGTVAPCFVFLFIFLFSDESKLSSFSAAFLFLFMYMLTGSWVCGIAFFVLLNFIPASIAAILCLIISVIAGYYIGILADRDRERIYERNQKIYEERRLREEAEEKEKERVRG